MNGLPNVTAENYFSPEINMAYMSHSQFLAFERCEAAALAELKGAFDRPATVSMLVGSYVDAWFSGELPVFQAQHPEIFKRDGSLKADYVKAQEIIARMESSELYMLLMSGEKQVIRTGTIAGVPFKIKIDSLLDGDTCAAIAERFPYAAAAMGLRVGAIVDQKVMRDTADVWDEEERGKVPFWRAWGYDVEGAIYQAVEGNLLPFILAVGTKEDPADLWAGYLNGGTLAAKLCEVEDRAPRYQAIKEGRIRPARCEQCAYCRATRSLNAILDCEAVPDDE